MRCFICLKKFTLILSEWSKRQCIYLPDEESFWYQSNKILPFEQPLCPEKGHLYGQILAIQWTLCEYFKSWKPSELHRHRLVVKLISDHRQISLWTLKKYQLWDSGAKRVVNDIEDEQPGTTNRVLQTNCKTEAIVVQNECDHFSEELFFRLAVVLA